MERNPKAKFLPHFLVIGAQKTGTKWLFHNLVAHPHIHIPPAGNLEVHYFDDDEKWGDVELYSKHFHPKGKERVIGDITPDYAVLKEERIAYAREIIPEAKIIYTLRNPKQRAISHLRMIFKKTRTGYPGESPGLEISPWGNLADMIEFCEAGAAFDHSNYIQNLRRWLTHFSEEQVLLLPYDLLKHDPKRYLQKILLFLGVDPVVDDRYPLWDRVHVSIPYPIPRDLYGELDRIYDPIIRDLDLFVNFSVEEWLLPSS